MVDVRHTRRDLRVDGFAWSAHFLLLGAVAAFAGGVGALVLFATGSAGCQLQHIGDPGPIRYAALHGCQRLDAAGAWRNVPSLEARP